MEVLTSPQENTATISLITMPIRIIYKTFKLAVIGTTPTGGPFIRMHRDVIEPVNIKLDHIPEKGNKTVSNYRTSQYYDIIT
jgi:hypothetical protein